MDEIAIKRLEVFAKHGVLPEENVLGQKFLISATLYCDTAKAGKSDVLSDSISYAEVAELIKTTTEQHVFKLLERLAACLAQSILQRYPQIEQVDIEIEKPWAPVLLSLETVSVKISRQWNTAYLSIGSNLGDKRENLLQAIQLLNEDEGTQVTKQSSFLVTKPVGEVEQDDFLNAALEIKTLRSPEELLELIAFIEKKLKRERVVHWGPRTIDLDIIFYNDEVIQSEALTIPHIEMANRMFVLEPLCEIAPYAMHPAFHKTVAELKEQCTSTVAK
jgi:dihydroneopterin aldolase/2-amino-4-hydroxy-6-hydroxymethyldihydropteridine diphosphokinase